MKSLLNDDTAQYLKKIDYTSTWSVGHHYRFLLFANYVVKSGAKKVLDVGFGKNMLIHYLIDAGFDGEYIAVDINQDYIDAGQQEWDSEISKRDGCECSAQYVFGETVNMEVDVVVLGEFVEHIPKDTVKDVLAGYRKQLTDGGSVIISTPNKHNGELNWPDDHEDEFELDELLEVVAGSGLVSHQVVGYWNNTAGVKSHLTKEQLATYENDAAYLPASLLNVQHCLSYPRDSRAVIVIAK